MSPDVSYASQLLGGLDHAVSLTGSPGGYPSINYALPVALISFNECSPVRISCPTMLYKSVMFALQTGDSRKYLLLREKVRGHGDRDRPSVSSFSVDGGTVTIMPV